MEEFPVSNLSWVKYSHLIAEHLFFRLTPTAYWLMDFICAQAAKQDTSKDPGEVEVRITLCDLKRGSRKKDRTLEYAIEEIGQTRVVTDPGRLKKIRAATGRDTVGKNFVAVRTDPREPRVWNCRLLPKNWLQGPGEPGEPITKPIRKARTCSTTMHHPIRLAALMQSVAPRFSASDESQFSAKPGETQAIASLERISGEASHLFAPDPERTNPPSQDRPQPYIGRPSSEGPEFSVPPEGPTSSRTFAMQTYASPVRGDLRADSRTSAENPAEVCTGDPNCPYWVRKTSGVEKKELGSHTKRLANPETAAEVAASAQHIEQQRGKPGMIPSNFPRPSEFTLLNLLDAARQALPAPVIEVGTFLAKKWNPTWKNWGFPVAAVKCDLGGFLRSSGWSPVWLEQASEKTPEVPLELPVEEAGDPWLAIKSLLEATLTPQEFTNWLERTRSAGMQGDNLVVHTCNQVTIDFIQQEFGALIRKATETLNLPIQNVIYRVQGAP